jgi:chemotaxis protein methyltransferase CheR
VEPLALEIARDLIAKRYGFRVNCSWSGMLTVSLAARTAATGSTSMDDYVHSLVRSGGGGSELSALAEDLLNGETHFLRTAPHFDALRQKLVPEWRTQRDPGQNFRIASLGCSTGEEVYSIALVLHEVLSAEELSRAEITGVDVNSRSLDRARTGIYESFQLRELSRDQWTRWFTMEGNRWRVQAKLRESVRFLQHNLLDPLPFASLDAIFCRNVMIYFHPSTVAECIREFHAALRPGGYLFLGHSESAFGYPQLFEAVPVPDGVIYQKKIASPLSQ